MSKPSTRLRVAGGGMRRLERVPHVCLAWVKVQSGDAIEGLARTLDLSSRGVGLVLSRELPVSTRLAIDLLLPGTLRLKAEGEVVHAGALEGGQFRVGVRFFAAPMLADPLPKEDET